MIRKMSALALLVAASALSGCFEAKGETSAPASSPKGDCCPMEKAACAEKAASDCASKCEKASADCAAKCEKASADCEKACETQCPSETK